MKCTFCGSDVAWGKGKMFVQADGSVVYFCSSKCQRNARIREPRRAAWTAAARKEKEARLAVTKASAKSTKVQKG